MRLIIKVGKFILQIIYFFLKFFPTQNKILFLSRQSNKITLDYKILLNELDKYDFKKVIISGRIESIKEINLNFIIDLFRSMYHLATSKICIVDSYSLPVSVLKHKKVLYIIQIWHAMGKIKQSGYQTLDKPGGRSKKISEILDMHKNYNLIIAGAENWNFAYTKSFNVSKDLLWNIGLPRGAYISNNKSTIRKKIYKKYPEFKDKKVIIYSPTFRNNKKTMIDEVINKIDFENYILIVSSHPKHQLFVNNNNVYLTSNLKFCIYELLCICDYFITDYSSLAIEAAILNKKTYYYLYDYDEYKKENGLNLDVLIEFPTISFKNIDDLLNNLYSNNYDEKAFNKFRKQYIPHDFSKSTEKLVEFIVNKMKN